MALETLSYENDKAVTGASRSQYVFVCDWSERETQRALLLSALDGNDLTLKCYHVHVERLRGDPACGKAQLTADFDPIAKVDAKRPDQPFKWRLDFTSEAFTVSGDETKPNDGWKWKIDHADIKNKNVLPVKQITMTKIVLFGTRTSIDLASYDAYADKVNDGDFLGAFAGCVLFRSASASPRQADDGSEVVDVELELLRRNIPWNEFFRETGTQANPGYAGTWQAISRVEGGQDVEDVYQEADFDGLLEAP